MNEQQEVAAAAQVREALASHFVMWRDLDGPHHGEWFCECGLKFGFSDTAIDHQAEAVERIVQKVKGGAWAEGYRAAMTASIGLQGRPNVGASFPADALDHNPYREAPR